MLSLEHHGGRYGYSTLTALTKIHNQIYKNKEKNKITAIITTDLTAAFDTVDHDTLLQKLSFYGLKGIELKLFKSYLKNRQQYVKLNTFNSKIEKSLPCSVIQGSVMSGLLYTIYVNELPELSKLVFEGTKNCLDKKDFSELSHKTINYVDDSTSVIGFKDKLKLKKYLDKYFELIDIFYTCNKLLINPDKTKLIIMSSKKLRKYVKDITFKAGNFIIKQDENIKILGTIIQNNHKNDKQVNSIISKSYYKLHEIIKIKNYIKFNSRKSFINSIVMGILYYNLPLYFNISKKLNQKLHKLQMTCCRIIMGGNCYRISNVKLLSKCNWLSINNMIRHSTLTFIHKITTILNNKSINEHFLRVKSLRNHCKSITKYEPKSTIFQNFFIYRGNTLYNDIPNVHIK